MDKFINFIKIQLQRFKDADKGDRTRVILIFLMQIAFIGAIPLSILEREWLTLFICIVAIVVVWMPSLLSKNFKIYVPIEFELLLNIFIYLSLFLGEIRGYYTKFAWWDIVLHTGSGIALGFIGFLILYSLYRSGRLQAPPFLIAVFSFCFALALGALWEIFEFTADSLFGFNMQKSGLVDTMWDLIVDAIGALIISVSGYFYIKNQNRGMGILKHYLNSYFKSK